MNSTLVVSRAYNLYPDMKEHLEKLGYSNITFTNLQRDGLLSMIRETNPDLVLMGSSCYQAATPFMIGEILKEEPDLNIAAVSINDFPISIAPWYIWHGAKSCLHLWADGMKEFNQGLKEIKNGKEYISPIVKKVMDFFPEWPDTKDKITRRQFECLILLCCGFTTKDIANEMIVTRKTIDKTIAAMFDIFHVYRKEELIYCAWASEIITKEDLKFFPRYKRIKMPEYLIRRKNTINKLKEIYKAIYGE